MTTSTKEQLQDENMESTSETDSNVRMHLTDLNDDCLREILELLSLSDLTSVSTTNKRLNELAVEVFSRSFARRLIEMTSSCISVWDRNDQRIQCNQIHKQTPDWQTFFYYFGPFLTRLSIQFDDKLTLNRIERIMFKRCIENLIELKLSGIRAGDEIKTNVAKFSNVVKLSIYSCEIPPPKLYDFLEWFPAVIDLELVKSYTSNDRYNYAFLAPNNRNLQRFKCIEAFKPFDPLDFDELLSNDLKSLSIGFSRAHINSDSVSDFIFRAIETRQESSLEVLELYNLYTPLDPPLNGSLNLRKLKINGLMPVGDLLPSHFEHLEELELEISESSHDWIRFITQLPLLKKLSIRMFAYNRLLCWDSVKDHNFLKIAEARKLEEFTFTQRGKSISIATVRRFLFQCDDLNRLKIIYYSKNDEKRHQFRHSDFGPMWKVSEDFLTIVIEKK